jgi:hypothetical protein
MQKLKCRIFVLDFFSSAHDGNDKFPFMFNRNGLQMNFGSSFRTDQSIYYFMPQPIVGEIMGISILFFAIEEKRHYR